MKLRRPSIAAFSLVELTLALGVGAFCLVAVFGLVPVAVQTNRNATSQTVATNILSSVVSDIRASAPGQGLSAKYRISRAKNTFMTLYFDRQGQSTTSLGPNSRYRLYVKIANNPANVVYPNYVWLKVSWPAAVDTINTTIAASGSVETVAAFFVK